VHPRPSSTLARLRSAPWRVGALLVAFATIPAVALAQERCDLDQASLNVRATAMVGNTLYLGGDFSSLGRPTGGALGLDPVNAQLLVLPNVLGAVHAIAPDGSGGWYLGGLFTHVGGVARSNLAQVQADGTVLSWNPGTNGTVQALAVSGGVVYAGGSFSTAAGQARLRIAAIDATGAATAWNPGANIDVHALAVDGSTVYAGGGFPSIGGAPRNRLAALDAATGTVDAGFVPPPRYPGRFEGHTGKRNDTPATTGDPTGVITSLLVTPDGRHLMVGGSFLHFGYDHAADEKHRHSGLVALDPATGALTAWQPDQGSSSSRPVFGMTAYPADPHRIGIDASSLIFTASGGAGGRVIAWVPGGKTTQLWRGNMDGDVMAVAATSERVYVVGHYDHTVPDPNDPCLDVRDLGDGHVGVSCPDGTPSRHLAAFYASGEIANGKNTGKARIDTDFTAQADTSEGPYAILVGADRLYVGGNFSKIAATPVSSGGMRTKQPGFAVYPALP
jgi:hypothetical protein